MTEQGKVIKIKGGKAVVRLTRTAACKGCNACGMLGNHLDLVTENQVNCAVGDSVQLVLQEKSAVFAAVAYLIPLGFLFVGLVIGILTGIHELYVALIAAGTLAIGFFIAYYVDRTIVRKKNLNPQIVRVIADERQEDVSGGKQGG